LRKKENFNFFFNYIMQNAFPYGLQDTAAPNGVPLHLIFGVARLFPQLRAQLKEP
jgi:hypothetical protein